MPSRLRQSSPLRRCVLPRLYPRVLLLRPCVLLLRPCVLLRRRAQPFPCVLLRRRRAYPHLCVPLCRRVLLLRPCALLRLHPR